MQKILDSKTLNIYYVDTMYVDTAKIRRKDKTYTRHLLRTSYRENGKVRHKTLLKLSSCSKDEINAIKLALKHKKKLVSLASIGSIETVLGKRIGSVWFLKTVAEKIGLAKALGTDQNGKLAMLQVIARVANQGSRLSAVRFAKSHAVCEILGIQKLNEDDLYENLAWLSARQEAIEKKLFHHRFPGNPPTLFLYDVTSTYLEGICNELANWGYNRDKKKGKMQIVIGLLTGPDGLPVAVRVFEGNTPDTKTVSEQVRALAKSFGVKDVMLVGDRGMLKGPQIKALPDDFRYITAITKPQIQKMLNKGVLQYALFDKTVCEVEDKGIRYVLRRNPFRAEQIALTRLSKQDAVEKIAAERTRYLAEHLRADVEKARQKVQAKINKLKADKWLTATVENRVITVRKDDETLSEVALLDGCYVIKSDVSKADADAQVLHDRYCDLENVERAFRTMKSVHLEMRPVFVKKKESTNGHVFVVMLSLLLQREIEKCWSELDITVEEGLDELGAIHVQEVRLGNACIQDIPKPNKIGRQLLKNAGVNLPSVLPKTIANVDTKKKLQSERKRL
jgi:transposase